MRAMKIICVIGTRPEAIKLAPVISALKKEKFVDLRVLNTAQHRDLLDQTLNFFQIVPDIDLNIMRENQDLANLTARLLININEVLITERPDLVIIQGDTSTVLTTALACFYLSIPVAHVEAGLRTYDMHHPFPEEFNRIVVSKIATFHFAATEGSRQNLLKENINSEVIYVTGNTVIDSLMIAVNKEIELDRKIDKSKKIILVTMHRRENFGQEMISICEAIATLAEEFSDIQFVLPVHPNPNVKNVISKKLGKYENIYICDPMDYGPFVAVMKNSYLIITDSGGVQEEAPALAKPVIVIRNKTERPEAVEEGVVKVVGTNKKMIVEEVSSLIRNESYYMQMARGVSPYGDGYAAARICLILKKHFGF
jgi:UDP-N-acetylglucosamine 2-epimerase (non-hydrolysing)